MQIDWLTVVAQIINFLVLVWLLQRFLYEPITHAMEQREARIKKHLSEARAARDSAQEEALEWRRQQQRLDDSKQALLGAAKAKADELQRNLMQGVHTEVQGLRQAWRKQLTYEEEAFLRSLKKQANHQVTQIVARVLATYTNSGLLQSLSQSFAQKLADLPASTRTLLKARAGNLTGPAFVESSLPLDTDAKNRVRGAIAECIGAETGEKLEIEFKGNPDLLLGIRLIIGEQSFEWSASQYLSVLETEVEQQLEGLQQDEKPC